MQKETIEGYRLSPQQERLWHLQSHNGATPYRALCEVLLEGDLDQGALRSALTAVVRRHEILRTRFCCLNSVSLPVQVICEESDFDFDWHDLSGRESEEIIALEAGAILDEARQKSFDFEQGPLLRVQIVTLSQTQQLLLISLPALCADRAGLSNLVAEIRRFYRLCVDGIEEREEALQYADLAEWQNELVEIERTGEERGYWRGQGYGVPDFKLVDERQPQMRAGEIDPVADFDPAVVRNRLEEEVVEEIERVIRQRGITKAVFFSACLKVLLWRLAGQVSVTIGVVFDGRPYEELHEALGLFARLLPIGLDVGQKSTFDEVLEQVAGSLSEARKRQEHFFWEDIEASPVDIDFPPFIPYVFEYAEEPPQRRAVGVDFTIVRKEVCTERFKIKLCCTSGAGGLYAELYYDSNLLSEESMRRLNAQFQCLVRSALGGPESYIDRLEILTACERERLLHEWNNTNCEYPQDACLPDLIETQVERTPDAIAVVFEDAQLCYIDLNRRANRLARYLRRLGVSADARVGIVMERSLDLVVGLLGVLKAGGAYVPLDPEYPRDRLAYMLRDAGVSVLLTERKVVDTLPDSSAQIVCLDDLREAIERESELRPQRCADQQNLAYVIYTSGSTGQPKGVMISHRAILNRLLWMLNTLSFNDESRVLQKTIISFDASVWELFGPLMCGGQVVMARPGGHRQSAYLVKAIDQHQVTVLQLVPSMLQAYLKEPSAKGCRSLRQVFCGGETVPSELKRRFEESLDGELHNLYGPTETSIDATHWLCERGDHRPIVPIGKPISNTQIHILDRYLRPVPAGVPGHLHVGGAGLARGYLDRPNLTAERFIPHLYADRPGGRLYRTGDLARYLADGSIEFLGRLDQQVKVRGMRIEPGEIEAALSEQPGVREAVVIVLGDGVDAQLVGYVVCEQGTEVTSGELRENLRRLLPEHMVPAVIVNLDQMPLTPNGKIDRRALPAIDNAGLRRKGAFVPPRNMLELQLTQIWEGILNVRPISATDDFFELGGHSLLVVRLMTHVERKFGYAMPLTLLFQNSTVEKLAIALGEQHGRTEWTPLIPIQAGGTKPPFFCVHPIGGQVVNYYLLSRYLGPEHPFYGLQARGLHDERVGDVVPIAQTAAHYIAAIQTVKPKGPYLLGGYSFGGVVAFEMAQQLKKAGYEVALLVLFDAHSSIFDRKLPEDDYAGLLVRLAWVTSRQKGLHLILPMEDLKQLGHDEQLKYFMREMKKYALLPADGELAYLRQFLKGFAARRKSARIYEPQVYDGRLTLLRCEQEDELTTKMFEEAGMKTDDRTLGWGDYVSDVDIRLVPGHHDVMMADPYVQGVAARLRECINDAEINCKGQSTSVPAMLTVDQPK
jgi:amino acid adenylation domain-containing protein